MVGKVRTATFFATNTGAEPVRKWLRNLPEDDRGLIGKDIARVEYGASLKLPLIGHLGERLWEVRTHLRSRRIARVFFTLVGTEMVLLHAIIKKSQKTPATDLKLARQRLSQWEKSNK